MKAFAGVPARLLTLSAKAARGTLAAGSWHAAAALGPAGVRALKREGDSATPRGVWPLRQVLYRADRLARPRTPLPCKALKVDDGWCDASEDRNYNRYVQLPYHASAERLWRDDEVYDVIVVLGFNDVPRRRAAGSAIFLHVARADLSPTAGCIALMRDDLLALLEAWPAVRAIDTRRRS